MNPWPFPLWIAHRGAGKLAPENTLAAFRLGLQHGYRAFECDLKLSRDETCFLLHDDTLGRTSNGSGSPADQDWDGLRTLDAGAWHSPPYVGEPLPTLTQIAAFCLANTCALNIEIKPCPGVERRTGEVVAREAARLWAPAGTPPPLLSSFKPDALEGARDAAPELPRALLLDTLWDGWFDCAERLGVVAVITNYRVMDAALIQRLHGQGWRALVYTVNEGPVAERLIAEGIDGIITDAVNLLG